MADQDRLIVGAMSAQRRRRGRRDRPPCGGAVRKWPHEFSIITMFRSMRRFVSYSSQPGLKTQLRWVIWQS